MAAAVTEALPSCHAEEIPQAIPQAITTMSAEHYAEMLGDIPKNKFTNTG
jgi:hypothetical protein